MRLALVAIFLLICESSDCADVRCLPNGRTVRAAQRQVMQHRDHYIFYIVSYALIHDISFEPDSAVRNFIFDYNDENLIALSFFWDNGERCGFFTNGKQQYTFHYHFTEIMMDSHMEYYVATSNKSSSDQNGVTLLHSCKVWRNQLGNKFTTFVERAIILLLEGNSHGFDMEQANEILGNTFDMINIKYFAFDAKGFNICDDFNFFINECETHVADYYFCVILMLAIIGLVMIMNLFDIISKMVSDYSVVFY